MPKNNIEKDTKKSSVSKKVNNKVETKKKNVKNSTKKDIQMKKVEVKKPVEVKTEVKKVEIKNSNTKNDFTTLVNKVVNNTPFVIALCIILILTALLIATASSKRITKTSKGEEIVATIKGKTFTADDLYKALKDKYGTNALINEIDEYIADKEVKVTSDDKEYVQEVVDYYKEYAKYYNTDLETFLSSYVGLQGISTEEEFFDYVLADYKKTLAVQNFIGDNASEDELKKFYKENFSDKLTVKHILIEIDSDADDADEADQEAYDKAVSLIKELDKTKEKKLNDKFDELAKNNSDDTATYSDGGLIEDFEKNDVEEAFYNAADELEDGEYTKEPIKTSYGYHIILKVSSTPVEKYKNIKDEVKKAYAEDLLSNDSTLQVSKWAELRKQYKLSIKDDTIKDLYNETIKNATKKDADNDTEEE